MTIPEAWDEVHQHAPYCGTGSLSYGIWKTLYTGGMAAAHSAGPLQGSYLVMEEVKGSRSEKLEI